jgi:glyoxylase-like metal-dependent hydrolase (beta-lactamase superfamily II)
MKRPFVLGLIVLAGTFASVVAQVSAQAPRQGGPPGGRGGRGPAGLGAIEKVADNLYSIPGGGAGNTAVFVTASGVVLVDTKLANNGQAIMDQVRTVTDRPITHIINTHTHPDHTGSNAFFEESVQIVTHQNTAGHMKGMPQFAAPNGHGLPDRTFTERETLLSGTEAIDLYYFGRAHTDGDIFVVFRTARTMHAGDAFAGALTPFVDTASGGSVLDFGETLARAAAGITGVEIVIPGHAATTDWQAFLDYGEFNRLVVEHGRASRNAGKTAEQALIEFKPPAKFSGYNLNAPFGRGGKGGNFSLLYEELQAAR